MPGRRLGSRLQVAAVQAIMAAALGALVVAAGAGAASAAAVRSLTVVTAAGPRPVAARSDGIFAGYFEPAAVTTLTGVVTVPALSCPSSNFGANETVQTDGSGGGVGSFITLVCRGLTASYSGVLFVSPAPGPRERGRGSRPASPSRPAM